MRVQVSACPGGGLSARESRPGRGFRCGRRARPCGGPVKCRGATEAWPAGLRGAAVATRTASGRYAAATAEGGLPCVYRRVRVPKAARASAPQACEMRDAPGRGSVCERRASAAVPRERGPQGCAERPRSQRARLQAATRPRPPKAVCRACPGAGVSRRRLERACRDAVASDSALRFARRRARR